MHESLRRAMLFAPGNNPGLLQHAGIYGADSLIFDLEDAVSIHEKDAARILVRNALATIRYPCEVGVRINHISTPWGFDDLAAILPARPDFIRLPKCEEAEEIKRIDDIVTKAERRYGFPEGSIRLMAAIESPRGLRNAFEIASASPRMMALAIGGEDFATSLKTTKTKDGAELFAARSMIVYAAREADISPIDSVFSDLQDEEGFIRETELARQLGFDGKSCVHPRQIELVHRVFTPSEKEIQSAQRILKAYREAMARKAGVVAVDGKMIDAPMIIRARRTLAHAVAAGLVPQEDLND
ncbi:MAG: aldolase/citrate lyase family protein [Spirochaetaceae bacterium]|nr:aldolase/citrate lyase family protein [Spirochaetaceae bacterium]